MQLLNKLNTAQKKFLSPLSTTLADAIKPLIENVYNMSTRAMHAFKKLTLYTKLESSYTQLHPTFENSLKDETDFWTIVRHSLSKELSPKSQLLPNAMNKINLEIKTTTEYVEIEKNLETIVHKFKKIEQLSDLTNQCKGTFIQHTDAIYHPISLSLAGHCRGVIFDWAYRLKLYPPKTTALASPKLIKFTQALKDIKAKKFPVSIPFRYALFGEDTTILATTIHNQLYYSKLTKVDGNSVHFNLNCEGRVIAAQILEFLQANNQTTISNQPRILEIILYDINMKKSSANTPPNSFCHHQIGFAQFLIQHKTIYRVKDDLFGEFEFLCSKQLSIWLDEYFKFLNYPALFFGFSMRILDKALQMQEQKTLKFQDQVKKESATNVQESAAAVDLTTPQFRSYITNFQSIKETTVFCNEHRFKAIPIFVQIKQ